MNTTNFELLISQNKTEEVKNILLKINKKSFFKEIIHLYFFENFEYQKILDNVLMLSCQYNNLELIEFVCESKLLYKHARAICNSFEILNLLNEKFNKNIFNYFLNFSLKGGFSNFQFISEFAIMKNNNDFLEALINLNLTSGNCDNLFFLFEKSIKYHNFNFVHKIVKNKNTHESLQSHVLDDLFFYICKINCKDIVNLFIYDLNIKKSNLIVNFLDLHDYQDIIFQFQKRDLKIELIRKIDSFDDIESVKTLKI